MQRRRKDSGFALLLILLMGAMIAITLYVEIPRVAFEAQRQKEQLLIERGEQYKRAIQLFVKANNRWPARIEELESFNNRHYLRRRFKDPMTGKDEWRLVHIQNGVLTDSVTTKQNANQEKGSSTLGQYVGVQAGIGQTIETPGQGGGGVNLAMRQRASDRSLAATGQGEIQPELQAGGIAPGVPGQPGQQQPQPLPNSQLNPQLNPVQLPPGIVPVLGNGQPGMQVGQIGMQSGQPVFGQPGMGRGGAGMPPMAAGSFGAPPVNNTNTGNTYVGGGGAYVGGGSYIGSQPTAPAVGPFSGLPGQPGPPVSSQTGGVSPYPIAPGANGQPPNFGQPGMQMNPQGQNAAAQMISQILTTPRPGGIPQGVQGGIIGAGIAGVASNSEDDSIMLYNDRTNYGEWEFIFDPLKQKVPPNPLTGAVGNPAAAMAAGQGQVPGTGLQPGVQPGVNPGVNPGIGQTPFGQNPNMSPFGQQPPIPPVRRMP